jgi:hypothetical protein
MRLAEILDEKEQTQIQKLFTNKTYYTRQLFYTGLQVTSLSELQIQSIIKSITTNI